jgi:Domain of unknown function (DUF4402)
MNKNVLYAIAGSIIAASLPGVANAQSTASANATGSTTIVRPITLTKTADLAFGRIVKPTSGSGTVTMADSADTVAAASGAIALTGITTSRAKFTIDGEGGQAVSVSVPATLTMTKGADTITVTLDPDLGSSVTLSNALAAAGSASLNVGGNFTLPSAQATGLYTGSFTVTVAYQ